jgi:NADP-dependent 3-hydroxy acid dehydrogenase YdfG
MDNQKSDNKNSDPGQYPRIAIVTGATSGIGEAISRMFLKSGYGVVGTGRNERKLTTCPSFGYRDKTDVPELSVSLHDHDKRGRFDVGLI